MAPFEIRGFNLCESILRHSPDQLRTFFRRMKTLQFNTAIIHYDYGWKRHHRLILDECRNAGVGITLMTFGPRTFFSYAPWKPQWFAKRPDGSPFTKRLECETYPCRFEPEALEAFRFGAEQWLRSLPTEIRRVHMRAADGLMFCQCPKCRVLPEHERWQPFVELFTEAVQRVRPDLEFETDVYVKRYNIPGNRAPFAAMQRIMYDTFYRCGFFPIGSALDTVGRSCLVQAAAEKNPDSPTPNSYHGKRLAEWTSAFPGKVYLHENVMGQGLFGTFQHNTGVYLRDLELYSKLGVKGVCLEAYEPGYANFAPMFETLAKAMRGEEVEHRPDALEQILPQTNMRLFCDDLKFPLEKYISDPFVLRQADLFRRAWCTPSPEVFREYLDFAFEHEDRMDPLFIGFGLASSLHFRNLSEEAQNFVTRRKLWDFMEDIPGDPIPVCRRILEELYRKSGAIHADSAVCVG